jgi:hypothetical protein
MSHMIVAASAKAIEQMFALVVSNFNYQKSGGGSWGPFSASYDIQVQLQGGSIQLNNNDTVEIQDLNVVFNTLTFQVCFNLPGFCIGGECIIPDPIGGCLVSLPHICIGGPICLPLDLSGLTSEVENVTASLVTQYWVDPTRPPGISDLTAEFMNKSNEWRVYLDPQLVDILPINVAATIGNILENAFKQAIEDAFSWVPGFAWPLIWAVLGPLLDRFKTIIGIAEDIQNWVEDLLNKTFNLLSIVETALAQYFASQYPLFKFEDPYQIIAGGNNNNPIPVKIPIRNLAVQIDAQEMVLTADIGP